MPVHPAPALVCCSPSCAVSSAIVGLRFGLPAPAPRHIRLPRPAALPPGFPARPASALPTGSGSASRPSSAVGMVYGEASVLSSAGMVLSTRRAPPAPSRRSRLQILLICFAYGNASMCMLISDCSEICTSTRMLSSSLRAMTRRDDLQFRMLVEALVHQRLQRLERNANRCRFSLR